MPPKGILKTCPSQEDHSSKHVQWDEVKLKATDEEKSEFAQGQFANEPKTPFHQPQQPDTDVEMFTLMRGSEDESSTTFTESEAESNVSYRSGVSEDDFGDFQMMNNGEDEERHRRFLEARAQHYLMKGARERGQHLVESEEE